MTRDHFSKVMQSPYFQSESYKESPSGKIEAKIEKKINDIKVKLMFWKRKK